MNKHAKVFIFLWSYNHAKYLRESIDSVLHQTFSDFELLILDDASTDDSWDIINSYSDSRIRAFKNKTNKLGDFPELFPQAANGEYIAIHHSDDIWEPEKLKKQVAFLDGHPDIGAVFTNAMIIGEQGEPFEDETHFYYSIYNQPNRSRHEWLKFFFHNGNALCHPSVLIRKVCYEKCGSYRYGLLQLPDFDMWIRLCLKYEIYILPDKLIRFRVRDHEANMSGNQPEKRIRGVYELYKVLENYKKIDRFDDLVKVFPSAEKYNRGKETDIHFVLAMIALEEKPFIFTQLFGLDILFDLISDPIRSANIKRLYDFDYIKFIDLTAKHDVFSREVVEGCFGEIARLNQVVDGRDGEIANLNQAVTERDAQLGKSRQIQETFLRHIISFHPRYRFMKIFNRLSIRKWFASIRGRSLLAASDMFDGDYYFSENPDVKKSGVDPIKHYLIHGWKELRNPSTSFSTRQYLIDNPDVACAVVNPLVHYLRSGHLEGRVFSCVDSLVRASRPESSFLVDDYCFAVPFDSPIEKPSINPSIAIICHMYYTEILEEVKRYLSNIPFPFDLFITTDSEQKKNDIATSLSNWDKGAVEIRLVPNQGRDIAPKLISCRDVYDRYEYFLHIHSKKSQYGGKWSDWRSYLLKTLLGSKKIVESVFEAFDSDSKLGIIAPEHFPPALEFVGWGGNFSKVKELSAQLGMQLSSDGKMDFPSGSMFWGRSAAIKPLLDRKLTIEDFPPEYNQTDGTLAHAIKRLYFFICEQAGYRWIKIIDPALTSKLDRIIFIESNNSLRELINCAQLGLLASSKEDSRRLSELRNSLGRRTGEVKQAIRLAHAKSDLRTMEFQQFCKELEKLISKQESMIDFDEDFYLAAHHDVAQAVAKNDLLCGYVHYCCSGQFEDRIHSDRQIKRRFSIDPSYPRGLFAPVGDRPMQPLSERISLAHLPQSPQPFLLILLSHLQENIFFAGYSAFFKDYGPVFDRFDRVIIAVEHADFDERIALRYSSRLEVIHLPTINALKYKPDIIVAFNAHLACAAHKLLPDETERVVYYCQEFESGFFPYGSDYIIGLKAIANSHNLILSTELLRKFLVNRGLVKNQHVFVTCPKIEIFDVPEEKTNRLFFYYRPESFNTRNMPYNLMQVVHEFCDKHTGYEIYLVGSVATSYSFKINETQIYIVNKLPKEDYVKLISSCDVVVSMIFSAHPGVIAFQAAASGIPTVTNIFENRDASLLKNISNNIVPYDPVCDNLLDAIEQALAMPKGKASFDKVLYAGTQQGSLADFHDDILSHRRTNTV